MPKRVTKINEKQITSLSMEVLDIEGRADGKIKLPEEIFAVTVSPALISQVVRVYLANQRVGSAATKTRSQVRGSTKKIYRQKGTGRARHGDIKAPIFAGGGIAHGPHPRSYHLNLPKKMRRKALFGVLTEKLGEGKIKIVANLDTLAPKTKNLVDALKKWHLSAQAKTLLILATNSQNIILAGRNIANLTIAQASQLNTYQVLAHQQLILEKPAIDKLSEVFLKEKQIQKENRKQKTDNNDVVKDKSAQSRLSSGRKQVKKISKKTVIKRVKKNK